jgi:hypothetical protein
VALRECKECKAQISTDAKVCPHCGKKQKSNGLGCLGIIIVIAIFLAIWRIATVTPSSSNSSGDEAPSTSSPLDPKQEALSQMTLSFTWSKDEDVNIMHANFVVKNDSNYNVKDLEITCQHYAPSGTNIDSNTRTIYEVVNAHSTQKFSNFDMGFIHSQAVRSSCKITDLTVVQ